MDGGIGPRNRGNSYTGNFPLIEKRIIGQTDPVGTSVTFNNIPQIYNQLEIVMVARGSNAANTVNTSLQFNGDAGANYLQGNVNQTAGAAAAGAAASQTSGLVGQIVGANGTANYPGCISLRIPYYTNTFFYKNLVSLNCDATTGVNQQFYYVSAWANTSAINSIKVLAAAGNFNAGSAFFLYGIY